MKHFKLFLLPLLAMTLVFSSCEKKPEKITEIFIEQTNIQIMVGEQLQLTPRYKPEELPSPEFQWANIDSKIVSVTPKGIIEGKSIGKGKIRLSTKSNEYCDYIEYYIEINVIQNTNAKIILNKHELTLNVGEKEKLTYQFEPTSITTSKINWKSQNPNIATIDKDGNVTAISKGETIIIANASNSTIGSISDTCKIIVNSIDVTGISLSQNKYELEAGDSYQLIATISPENASNKNIIWESSNTSIATVSPEGLISALSEGSATIIAKSEENTTIIAKCSISVIPVSVKGISLNKINISLTKNDTYQLIPHIYPDNAKNKNIIWKSSNETIAKVDNNGNINTVELGECTITATTEDGGYSATCNVKVVTLDKLLNLSAQQCYISFGSTQTTITPRSTLTNNSNQTIKISVIMLMYKDGNVLSVDDLLKTLTPGNSFEHTGSTITTNITGMNNVNEYISNLRIYYQVYDPKNNTHYELITQCRGL